MKRLSVDPRAAEWHTARNESWTASAGAVLVARPNAELLKKCAAEKGIELDIEPLLAVGIEDFFGNTPWKSWAEKMGQIPRFKGNADTERGVSYETLILDEFEGILLEPIEREVTAISDDKPWLLASFDGVATDVRDGVFRIPVEAKCPAFNSRKKLFDSRKAGKLAVMGLPYYWVQVQHQILVADAPYGYFVAAGVEEQEDGTVKTVFPIYEKVPRDDAFLQAYEAIAKFYYEHYIYVMEEPPKLPSDEALLAELQIQAEMHRALTTDDSKSVAELYKEALAKKEEATNVLSLIEAQFLKAAALKRQEGEAKVEVVAGVEVVYSEARTVAWQKMAKHFGGEKIPTETLELYTTLRETVKIKVSA